MAKKSRLGLFFHGNWIQIAHRMFMEEEDDVFMFSGVILDESCFQVNPP